MQWPQWTAGNGIMTGREDTCDLAERQEERETAACCEGVGGAGMATGMKLPAMPGHCSG